uniref:Uncharacterized protein n=1 Tax=Megaselia scalaris TaxID=36166 RepID=T1GAS6_MEGSC
MALNIKLKEAFEVEKQYGAFYTGGNICWTSDGSQFLCLENNKINVVDIDSGEVVQNIAAPKEAEEDLEQDTLYTFDLSSDDESVITAHKSGLLKLWSKINGEQIKIWKSGHKGPIPRVVFRSKGGIVATGGSDSTVRVWDYEKKACLSALRGSQGVVSLVVFHPDVSKSFIYAAGDDNKINCWNYATKDHQKSVIPLYEALEGVVVLPKIGKLPNGFNLESPDNKDHVFAAIAGESGKIKVWECTGSKIVYSQTESYVSKAEEEGGLAITQLLHCPKTTQLAVVTADHNILVHNISTFHCSKQLIGFSDEILDICFVGKKSRYLAVATNSNDIKFYDTTNMNCQILKGHTDIVLAVSSHKNFLLSSGKDHTIRLWEVDPGTFKVKCLAKGSKHTSSVGSISFGKVTHTICASVSQDSCLKVWDIPKKFEDQEELLSLECKATQIAHEKDINCVTMSPNDQLIATASQDKTAKIWSASKLELLGIFKGHRRGVWSVRFSPVDQIF